VGRSPLLIDLRSLIVSTLVIADDPIRGDFSYFWALVIADAPDSVVREPVRGSCVERQRLIRIKSSVTP
jgi:hypothetical protein